MPIESIVFSDDLEKLEEVLLALDRLNKPGGGFMISVVEYQQEQLKIIGENQHWIEIWLKRIQDARRS